VSKQQQQHQQQLASGDCQRDDDERCCSNVAVSPAAATEDDRSPELQRLHDELVASKLREADAHLSMKEFEQKLLQLQRHWQVSVFSVVTHADYVVTSRLRFRRCLVGASLTFARWRNQSSACDRTRDRVPSSLFDF